MGTSIAADGPRAGASYLQAMLCTLENMLARRSLPGVLTAVVAAAACSSISLDQSPVGKPQLTVGDRWTTRAIDLWKNEEIETFEQTVTSVDGDSVSLERKTLSSRSGRPGMPSEDRIDAATWTLLTPRIIEGREALLAFPLYVGKTWEYEYKTVESNGSQTLQSRRAKVEAWEVVTTSAGMFKALKVVVDGRWRAHLGDAVFTGKVTETLWYSPEAKRWVKREWVDRTHEGRIADQVRSEVTHLELQK